MSILALQGPRSGVSPLLPVVYLTSTVLLASALGTVRAPLMVALAGLGAIAVLALLSGSPAWRVAIRQGGMFLALQTLLIIVFGIHRDRIEADRAAELHARNQELDALRLSLEERIRERTAELRERNGEMRLVFDNVAEGVFTVDCSGRMSSEHSATLARWFGPLHDGELFFQYFGRQSAAFGAAAEMGWQQLADGFLDAPLALDQMPRRLVANGRHYRFSYQPIGTGDDGRFLALVADATNEVEHDEMQLEKRETFVLFELMLADRSGFLGFMEEATQIVARVLAPGIELGELKRAVHTLKGNSQIFGLESVGRLCHDLEANLAEGPREEDLTRLRERWERLSADVDRLLGKRRNIIEISQEEHLAVEQAVQKGAPREVLQRMVNELKLESVDRRLQQFASQARQIARRVGKQVEVEVSHENVRLDAKRWSPFWAAFVHGIRNAIDHGIEPDVERVKSGKPKTGRIALAARREAGMLAIDIEDDGSGIDWEAIRRKCAALGLPSATHEDLVAALFADGVSTAQTVTDLSGRGVGMAALRAAVLALGGHISVKSERGMGTRLTMTFSSLVGAPEQQRSTATEPIHVS